jgi:hypothetical protein
VHNWSDKSVDWKSINAAAEYIGKYCSIYGRFGGQYKEKYGTVRFYAKFGHISLHTLVYPGYMYSKFPDWLWNLDIMYISKILDFVIGKLFVKWQIFIYKRAYKTAIKRWSHIKPEILLSMDHPELLDREVKEAYEIYKKRKKKN